MGEMHRARCGDGTQSGHTATSLEAPIPVPLGFREASSHSVMD